jgi:hypothetical protein
MTQSMSGNPPRPNILQKENGIKLDRSLSMAPSESGGRTSQKMSIKAMEATIGIARNNSNQASTQRVNLII